MPGAKLKIAALLSSALGSLLLLECASYLYLTRIDERELRVFEASDTGTVSGLGLKKNFSQIWKDDEFSVSVKTNNIGLREERDYRGEKVDIGFYGDSFTFGHGVEPAERYSNRLGERFPRKNILSFAYLDGWTTPHYYLFLKKFPRLIPDIGVVGLYLGNDLTFDIERSELFLDSKGDLASVASLEYAVDPRGFLVEIDLNPVTRLLGRSWFGELLLRNAHPFMRRLGLAPVAPVPPAAYPPPPEFDHGILNATNHAGLSYLLKMKRHLKSRGKRLVVFFIAAAEQVGNYPSPYDLLLAQDAEKGRYFFKTLLRLLPRSIVKRCFPSRFDTATGADIRKNQYLPKVLMKWCHDNDVECVNPVARFQELERKGTRLYFENDPHWLPAGHKAAADILGEYLSSTR